MRLSLLLLLFIITACSSVKEQTRTTSNTDDIIDIKWQLTDLNGEQSINESAVYLVISTDGKVTGNAGVNNYFGSWIILNNNITFTAMAATKMYRIKPTGVMDQEKQYLQLLSEVTRWRVSADKLQLFQANKIILEFQNQGKAKNI